MAEWDQKVNEIKKKNAIYTCCQLCLVTSHGMVNTCHIHFSGFKYQEIIAYCTGIKIDEDEQMMPRKLCSNCVKELIECFNFKKRCENIYKALLRLRGLSTDNLMQFSHDLCSVGMVNAINTQTGSIEKEKKPNKDDEVPLVNNHAKIVSKDIVMKEDYNKTVEEQTDKTEYLSIYGCKICRLFFLFTDEKWQHYKLHDDENESYCSICRLTFDDVENLKRHKTSAHVSDRYGCGYCVTRFDNKTDLRDHMKEHNEPVSASDSTIIVKDNNTLYMLEFVCDICNDTFANVVLLEKHRARVHTNSEEVNEDVTVIFKIQNPCDGASEDVLTQVVEDTPIVVAADSITQNVKIEVQDPLHFGCEDVSAKEVEEKPNIVAADRIIQNVKIEIQNPVETDFVKEINDEMKLEDHLLRNDKSDQQYEIIICNQGDETTLNDREDETMINDPDFQCTLCHKNYKSLDNLKKHEKLHKSKPYICKSNNCRRLFASPHNLFVHSQVTHNINDDPDGKFHCGLCSEIFENKSSYIRHVECHRLLIKHSCKFCFKVFQVRQHLVNHEKIHTKERPFLCDECGKGFITKDRMKVHIMRLHSSVRPYKCDTCPKSFASSFQLRTHQILKAKTFLCSECGNAFSSKQALDSHCITKHPSPQNIVPCKIVKCLICQLDFENQQLMDEHLKIHTCQYECHHCPKMFFVKTSLESHMKTHMWPNDRIHKCDECDASFNRSHHLKGHKARLHGDASAKTITCSHPGCTKTFLAQSDFKVHMRTHTKQKPFLCMVCEKRFATSTSLRSHSRCHTGEKPFICNSCHCGFKSFASLQRHMRRLHVTVVD